MSDDWLLRLLRRFARPDDELPPTTSLRAIDDKLTSLEREQREIEARLRLLEMQSNPRGISRGGRSGA